MVLHGTGDHAPPASCTFFRINEKLFSPHVHFLVLFFIRFGWDKFNMVNKIIFRFFNFCILNRLVCQIKNKYFEF